MAQTAQNGKRKQSLDEPLTPDAVDKASGMAVFDSEKKQVSFGDLIKAKEGEKVIVIFIRHFFCGFCQDYVTYLNTVLTPADLEKQNARLFFVGCGDAGLIKGYSEVCQNKFPVYAQPTRDIYKAFGLIQSSGKIPKAEQKPDTHGPIGAILSGVKGALKMGNIFAPFGNITQQGAEIVFGEDRKVVYSHRMAHAMDHAGVKDVVAGAGLSMPSANNGTHQNGDAALGSAKQSKAAGAVGGAAVAGGTLPASASSGAGQSVVSPPNSAPDAAPKLNGDASGAHKVESAKQDSSSAGAVSDAAVSGGPLEASAAPGAGSSKISPPGLAPPVNGVGWASQPLKA